METLYSSGHVVFEQILFRGELIKENFMDIHLIVVEEFFLTHADKMM